MVGLCFTNIIPRQKLIVVCIIFTPLSGGSQIKTAASRCKGYFIIFYSCEKHQSLFASSLLLNSQYKLHRILFGSHKYPHRGQLDTLVAFWSLAQMFTIKPSPHVWFDSFRSLWTWWSLKLQFQWETWGFILEICCTYGTPGSNTPILVRDAGDDDEWWMMYGEWWMVNDEWWIIVDDDDDDDDFLRWFNNILGTDQKFKLRVECNLEQKNAHKCPVLVPRLPISTSRTNTTLIRGLDYWLLQLL